MFSAPADEMTLFPSPLRDVEDSLRLCPAVVRADAGVTAVKLRSIYIWLPAISTSDEDTPFPPSSSSGQERYQVLVPVY